jgi:hypothetical protein
LRAKNSNIQQSHLKSLGKPLIHAQEMIKDIENAYC